MHDVCEWEASVCESGHADPTSNSKVLLKVGFDKQLRFFRSFNLVPKNGDDDDAGTLRHGDQKSFFASLGRDDQSKNLQYVNFCLENLLKFEDENVGHKFLDKKVEDQKRPRPNYDNRGRRLAAKVIERDK